jgi:DNA-binding NarL/FixJ family response regulator
MPSWVPTQPTGPISCVRSLREQWQLLRFTWRLTRSASASFTRWLQESRSPKPTPVRTVADMVVSAHKMGWTNPEIARALLINEKTVEAILA